MRARYDTIGINYSELRIPDVRIGNAIERALGAAQTILNVGAGTGSYEPAGRRIVAVEPSLEMIRKRSADTASVIQASAEALPFADDSFDASMAILTVHHWPNPATGLREMRRVTRGRVVVLTFDPSQRPWLTDYLPELAALDSAQMPKMIDYGRWLGAMHITPVPVPRDCSDGFLHAYWARPAAYLDERIRSGSSSFWALDDVGPGLARLERDIEDGAWERRYGDLLGRKDYDAGYRLVVSES